MEESLSYTFISRGKRCISTLNQTFSPYWIVLPYSLCSSKEIFAWVSGAGGGGRSANVILGRLSPVSAIGIFDLYQLPFAAVYLQVGQGFQAK